MAKRTEKVSTRPAKAAVVTGAAKGIGLGVAEALLAAGYGVVLADRDAAALKACQATLTGHAHVDFAQCDVSDEPSVRRLVSRAVKRFGGLDLLVSNAAIADPVSGPVTELSLADWDRRLRVNLTSVFLCAKHAAPHLRARRGSIINMSSTRALMSEKNTEAYAAAKGGIDALTHALAISLGPDVRVNAIRPGWVDTHGESLGKKAHAQHPVGRVGGVADIAATVCFLASEGAGFITGQCLTVDGGMTRKMIYED
jgi:NAD(P)-dependent dehydrogenase (short-subunit alcohol dehydrogenase family)